MENWKVKSVDGEAVENTAPPVAEEQVEQPVAEEKVEQPVEEQVYETPKNEDGDLKVNLDKPVKDAVQEQETETVDVDQQAGDSKEVVEEVREEPVKEIDSEVTEEFTVERVEDEPEVKEEVKQEVAQPEPTPEPVQTEPQVQLPENVEKLIQFMDETGGTLEDYVNLNKNIEDMDDVSVIREYYKQTKPHYDADDIAFDMDRKFLFDEEVDDQATIRAKKLAFKEELFNARKHLGGQKERYYADLKLNKQNDIAPEYKQAYDYYNEQQKIQEENQKLVDSFHQKTAKVFNDDFKGFDFKVGDSKFRIKVGDVNKTMEHQKDLNNFINEFIGDDGTVNDAAAYHKAIYTARNADKLAQHFYEQGRADALKNSAAKAKNIDMKPRQDNAAIVTPSGTKYKVVSGDSSNKLRIKMKQ